MPDDRTQWSKKVCDFNSQNIILYVHLYGADLTVVNLVHHNNIIWYVLAYTIF